MQQAAEEARKNWTARRPSEDSPFWLESRSEAKQILTMLAKKGERMTLAFGSSFLSTMILEVDADDGRIWLDRGTDERLNKEACSTSDLLLAGWLDKVEVTAEIETIWEGKWKGAPAFSATLPTRVHKLQRREYFRVQLPIAKPVKCLIRVPGTDSSPERTVECEASDLSVGGVCLLQAEDAGGLTPMTVYERCAMVLPELGTVSFSLEVRHIVPTETRSGQRRTRLGCRFIGLSTRDEALLQRYIGKVERERRMAMGS